MLVSVVENVLLNRFACLIHLSMFFSLINFPSALASPNLANSSKRCSSVGVGFAAAISFVVILGVFETRNIDNLGDLFRFKHITMTETRWGSSLCFQCQCRLRVIIFMFIYKIRSDSRANRHTGDIDTNSARAHASSTPRDDVKRTADFSSVWRHYSSARTAAFAPR